MASKSTPAKEPAWLHESATRSDKNFFRVAFVQYLRDLKVDIDDPPRTSDMMRAVVPYLAK